MLKKLKNGTFELPMENTYEFRYIIDGTYTNDEAADGYHWNDHACTENAVLEV